MMEKVPYTLPGFLIDEITEDSFYENLLLGVTSVLKSCHSVKHIRLERYPGATLEEVNTWEMANELTLPTDLRNFFLSTNGFSFTYRFYHKKVETDEISYYILGGIQINSLFQMERIPTNNSLYSTEDGLKFVAPCSKVHLLAHIDDTNCVVLAQLNSSEVASIWLYYKMKTFYLLCEDFVTYFRMALAHLGVPGWQLSVLNASLPEWSAEMLRILAPGITENDEFEENTTEMNIIDPDIFDIENSDSDTDLDTESVE